MLAAQVGRLWQALFHPEWDEKRKYCARSARQEMPDAPQSDALLYVDATLGEAGHARLLLEQEPRTRLLGLDADPQMLERGSRFLRQTLGAEEFDRRCNLENRRFSDYFTALPPGRLRADLILFDLGISLFHYAAGRGFSFRPEDPDELLDMRLNPGYGPSAAELLQNSSEAELADIFWRYGEVHNARKIARAIVEQRGESEVYKARILAALVRRLSRPGRIHPATQVFQALRIAVGDELGQLARSLPAALEQLRPCGLLAVISFHSLEDRLVKQQFRTWLEEGRVAWVYKKVIQAPYDSPLASERSAKLRVVRLLK